MPNANKCHLNIPFKNYLKSLRLNDEGGVDEASLKIAVGQEFENYKAIERRINDPACTPGATNSASFWGRAAQSFYEGVSVQATWLERANSGSGSSWVLTGTTLRVPAGVYQITSSCTVQGSAVVSDVRVGWQIFPGNNGWSANSDVLFPGADSQLDLSVGGVLYGAVPFNIFAVALVYTGGDPGFPTQSLRDRSLCVVQLTTSQPAPI